MSEQVQCDVCKNNIGSLHTAEWTKLAVERIGTRPFVKLDLCDRCAEKSYVPAKLMHLAKANQEVSAIEIVEAPGDACGNTRKLPDGSTCPGCRACA